MGLAAAPTNGAHKRGPQTGPTTGPFVMPWVATQSARSRPSTSRSNPLNQRATSIPIVTGSHNRSHSSQSLATKQFAREFESLLGPAAKKISWPEKDACERSSAGRRSAVLFVVSPWFTKGPASHKNTGRAKSCFPTVSQDSISVFDARKTSYRLPLPLGFSQPERQTPKFRPPRL